MYKVFYNKKNGKVVGYSDGPVTMVLPYVESKEEPLLMFNYRVVKGKLKVIKESFSDAEWEKIING